ncbi:MAG: hypothetical protein ACOCRK_11490 [bacterium]
MYIVVIINSDILTLLPNNVRANEVVTGQEGAYHKEYGVYPVDFIISSDWVMDKLRRFFVK